MNFLENLLCFCAPYPEEITNYTKLANRVWHTINDIATCNQRHHTDGEKKSNISKKEEKISRIYGRMDMNVLQRWILKSVWNGFSIDSIVVWSTVSGLANNPVLQYILNTWVD